MSIVHLFAARLFWLCTLLAAPAAFAQTVAVTFDDGPSLASTPRLDPAERNAALLAALAKHKVGAALFVTANNGAIKAGHAIGNHTMSHPDLHAPGMTLAASNCAIRHRFPAICYRLHETARRRNARPHYQARN